MKYFHGACACIVRGLGRGHTSLERTVVRYFHNRCSAPLLSLRENFAGCRGGVKWRGPAIDNTGPPHNTAGPPHGPFMAILLDEEKRGESLPRLWKISTDTRSNNEYSIHVLLSSHFWKIRFEKSERDLILSITSREYIYTSIKIRSPIYPILLEQNFSLETSLLLLPLRSSSGRSMRRMRERKREREGEKIDRWPGWTEQHHFFDNSAFMPDRTEEAVAHGADKKDEFSFPPLSRCRWGRWRCVEERRRGVSRGRRRRGISEEERGREEWRERGGASGVGQERV